MEIEDEGGDVRIRLYAGPAGGSLTQKISYLDTSGSKIADGGVGGMAARHFFPQGIDEIFLDNFEMGAL